MRRVHPFARSAGLGAALLLLAWAGAGLVAASQDPFPHEKHARLFPVCEGCHGSVSGDVEAERYPEVASCAECHDGTREDVVEWQGRAPRVSNLRFAHAEHHEKSAAAGDPAECRTCHAPDGAPVAVAAPEGCITCHEHRAPEHLADAVACDRCHVPLTGALALSAERLESFPQPAAHDEPGFLSAHGDDAGGVSCTVCHARESCERCHANADRLPDVARLSRDVRVASLAADRLPEYPTPATHDDAWLIEHAGPARTEPESCANCHTPPGCMGCHQLERGAAATAIATLPPRQPGRAPGVDVTGTVHAADIATRHAAIAVTGQLTCTGCHTTDTCGACHAGADSRAFHGENFVERHAADVFTRGSDCQSCHSTETFCRACHTRTGVAAQAGMTAAFHNAQPLWVLGHGQAARTGMESCAACHRQNDCVRCHSAAGGWGVNPHGREFAADRLAARNSTTCQWCHLSNPLRRN